MVLLVIGRFVNVALPLTLGELLHIFEAQYSGTPSSPKPRSPWPYLLAYVGLRFLQSSGGLGALRDVRVKVRGLVYFIAYSLFIIG